MYQRGPTTATSSWEPRRVLVHSKLQGETIEFWLLSKAQMSIAVRRDPIYRRRKFEPEIIGLCVRWYLTYRLSYRDLVEMMAERRVTIAHSTILRWVQRYVPEFEKRWSRYAKPVHSSWRMDETAVPVRGGCRYLYRAVDRYGKTVDSLLIPIAARTQPGISLPKPSGPIRSGGPTS